MLARFRKSGPPESSLKRLTATLREEMLRSLVNLMFRRQRGFARKVGKSFAWAFVAFVAIVVIAVATEGGSRQTQTASTTKPGPVASKPHDAVKPAKSATPSPTRSAAPSPSHPAPEPSQTHAVPAPAPTTQAPATTAPAYAAPTTQASPTQAPSAQAPAASCSPLTSSGKCYEPGEYCRDSDHGDTGVAGDGESIICKDNDGWRWEPV